MIRRECLGIQEGWSEVERMRRCAWAVLAEEVRMPEFGGVEVKHSVPVEGCPRLSD